MDFNEVLNQRTVYTALDFIGDIGGLSDGLRYIGALLIWLAHGDNLIQFLAQGLFKADKNKMTIENEESQIDNDFLRKTKRVIKNRTRIRKKFLPSPLCCQRCKQFAIQKSEKRISKELDVLTYFRKLKMLEIMSCVIFDKRERYLIKNQSCFAVNDLD